MWGAAPHPARVLFWEKVPETRKTRTGVKGKGKVQRKNVYRYRLAVYPSNDLCGAPRPAPRHEGECICGALPHAPLRVLFGKKNPKDPKKPRKGKGKRRGAAEDRM